MSWQREATSQQLLLRIQPSWIFLCINICLYILFILKEDGIGKQSFFEVKNLDSTSRNVKQLLRYCMSSCFFFFLIADVTVESKFSLLMSWKTYHLEYLARDSLELHGQEMKHRSFSKKKKKKAEVKKTHCFMNPQHNPETAAHLSHLIPIRYDWTWNNPSFDLIN